MKKIALFLVLVFCLALAACDSGEKEVDEYVNLKEETILEMGKKIETSPTVAGVDEARKVFDAKKGGLKAKRDALRDKKLGSTATSNLVNSDVVHHQMFDMIRKKFDGDWEADNKFVKLINDFNDFLK